VYPDCQDILDTLEDNRDWYQSQMDGGRGEDSGGPAQVPTIMAPAEGPTDSSDPQTSSDSSSGPASHSGFSSGLVLSSGDVWDADISVTLRQSSATVTPKQLTCSSSGAPPLHPVRVVGGPYRHNSVNLITRSTGSSQPNIVEEGDEG